MSKNTSTQDSDCLALSVRDVARLLHLSERSIWKMNVMARLPAPVRFGRSVRWLRRDVESWLAAGCPSRDTWQAMQKGGRP